MARPVDAEALEKKISEWLGQPGNGDYYSGYDAALCAVQDLIADTPTITPPNEAEKAIQRLGDFGKLFLDYSGCPRGPMGEPGGSTIEEWVTMMEPICDVDGGWWRPVPEKALQILLCEMRSLKQAVPPDHFPDSTKMVQGPPNEPLTLDVLREMNGEPVWIVEHPDWGHWELSADAEDYIADRDQDLYGLQHDDPAGQCGLHVLGWLAYRRPPEGEEG